MSVSVKIMLHPFKKRKDKTKSVVLRLTINRERSYYALGFNTHPANWNDRTSRFKKAYNPETYKEDNERLRLYLHKADDILLAMEREGTEISHGSFKQHFSKKGQKYDVYAFFDEIIEEFDKKGKQKTASTYKQAKSAVKRFHKKKVLGFKDVDIKFLNKLEVYLSDTCSGNAISVYFRSLRALYNKAISRGICKAEDYPFYNSHNQRGYKIKKLESPTRKRAIKPSEIKKIIDFQVPEGDSLFDTKNLFLFSFYNMGMNFIDMAYLKWSDVSDGRISYKRKKTNAQFSIEMLEPVKDILDYYKKFKDELGYVFPVFSEIHETEKQKYTRMQTARKKFNAQLRILAQEAGLENYADITSYVIRHSWASYMRNLGFSASYIKEGMKHSDEKTTEIYLKSIENKDVDDMNRKLLEL